MISLSQDPTTPTKLLLLPCKITYSQVLGVRMWTSLGLCMSCVSLCQQHLLLPPLPSSPAPYCKCPLDPWSMAAQFPYHYCFPALESSLSLFFAANKSTLSHCLLIKLLALCKRYLHSEHQVNIPEPKKNQTVPKEHPEHMPHTRQHLQHFKLSNCRASIAKAV